MRTFASIYSGRPQLGDKIKTIFITFQTDDPEINSSLIFYKRVLRLGSAPHFAFDFPRKVFLILYFFN